MDSTSRFRDSDEILGVNINNSVSLERYGALELNMPSSHSFLGCHSELKESDCVRMEVDLDSTLRTVQFFVNGEAGRSYVSGLPPSVRIGFSVYSRRTTFRIDNITRLPQPTPISEEMHAREW